MDSSTFIREQYLTLRREIDSICARLFWIITIGLFGVPLLTFLALSVDEPVISLVPYSALVLIVLYLAEQSRMMRAGRFVREHIEKNVDSTPGWEGWLESSGDLRLIDRHFSACFLIVFFMFYFTTIFLAIDKLLKLASGEPSGGYWFWFYGATVTYGIGAIWAISLLVHHWRYSIGTKTDGE